MANTFQRATRRAVKLKIGIQGPAGSGKTMGALALAKGLVPNGRIAFIDTESGSASLYADQYEFDAVDLKAPFTSARYLELMLAAADAGYDVLVIDSLSHQWAGPGGILARKEQADAKGGNQFTNWGPFSKEHASFQTALLALPIHVIAAFRTKQEYVVEETDRGKKAPRKVGLAAVTREGFDYEFSLMFELQADHSAVATKDRTRIFDARSVSLLDPTIATELRMWLALGVDQAPQASAAEIKAEVAADLNRATTEQLATIGMLVVQPAAAVYRTKIEKRVRVGMSEREAKDAIAFLEQVVHPQHTDATGESNGALALGDARRD